MVWQVVQTGVHLEQHVDSQNVNAAVPASIASERLEQEQCPEMARYLTEKSGTRCIGIVQSLCRSQRRSSSKRATLSYVRPALVTREQQALFEGGKNMTRVPTYGPHGIPFSRTLGSK